MTDFTADALELLMNHRWPGNVHANCAPPSKARWCCVAVTGFPRATCRAPCGPKRRPTSDPGRFLAKNDLTVKEAEKQLIIRALKETKGNRTLAAQKIGMPRRTFHRKLHTYHLEGF